MKPVISVIALAAMVGVLGGCKDEATTSANAHEPVASSQTPVSEPAADPICDTCGTVVAIETQKVDGKGSGAGAALGAVVGGLLGNQVGDGSGKKLATVVGAVGGAVAGDQIEKKSKGQTYYDVDVQMDTGELRTLSVASVDLISVGSDVEVIGNDLRVR